MPAIEDRDDRLFTAHFWLDYLLKYYNKTDRWGRGKPRTPTNYRTRQIIVCDIQINIQGPTDVYVQISVITFRRRLYKNVFMSYETEPDLLPLKI